MPTKDGNYEIEIVGKKDENEKVEKGVQIKIPYDLNSTLLHFVCIACACN